MKHITREDLPCWYELSWNEEKKSIILRLHELFFKTLRYIPQEAPIVIGMKKEFGLQSFSGDIATKEWGFESVFRRNGEDGRFILFEIPLPKIITLSGKKCSRCQGKREDQFYNRDCGFCDGTGCRAPDRRRCFSGS